MPSTKPTIKPNNHIVHPCPNDKKLALVHDLVAQNIDEDIIVVTSGDPRIIQESIKNAKVVDDKTLIKDKELSCTLLISFDIPLKAVIYIARLTHTTNRAILLLNESEQKQLYPIETLLGRVIKQKVVDGFEYTIKEKTKPDADARKPLSKEKIKEIAKQNYDKRLDNTPKPKQDKPKRDYKKDDDKAKQWEKKKKPANKYLGKDENGKAIFSGKSGDRNHRYDGTPKDRYDAPKKVGRKINIKSLKKSD